MHKYGRLFHQYIVDQYSKIELNRLNFIRKNQDKIRADLYENIKTSDQNELGYKIGKWIVLPSTFKGSPRNLQQLFQDSMSVIRAHGKPDLFITVTCKSTRLTGDRNNFINANYKIKPLVYSYWIFKYFTNF